MLKRRTSLIVSLSSAAVILALPTESGASPLSDAVANLSPGSWVELQTEGMVEAFGQTGEGASGNCIGYTESLKWDPATGTLFFNGMDHNDSQGLRFNAYEESSNAWVKLPQPAFAAGSGPNNVNHGYDHSAIVPAQRLYYFRYGYYDRHVRRYKIDDAVWSDLPDNNVLEYAQCCGGFDYFPEIDGLVWVQGSDIVEGTTAYGGVFLYTEASNEWVRLGEATKYEMGVYHNFAEYNPIHHVILFGGGNEVSRKIYKLIPAKEVVQLADAPVDLGVHQAIHTVDPISGEYLIFTGTGEFWTYDITTDQWTQQDASQVPIWTDAYAPNLISAAAAGPISTYGANAFVSCNIEDCHVYLYKHAPGRGTPWDGGVPGTGGSSVAASGGATAAAAGTTAGAGGASASGGEQAMPDATRGPDAASGCGCRTAGAGRTEVPASLALSMLGLWALRRRSSTAVSANGSNAIRRTGRPAIRASDAVRPFDHKARRFGACAFRHDACSTAAP